MKIYRLKTGGATKYYWLNLKDYDNTGQDFEEDIERSRITFGRESGTTDADYIGSTTGLHFFSDTFIDFLETNKLHNYDKTQLLLDKSINFKNMYYHVRLKSSIPRIQNQDMFSKPDIGKYIKANNARKEDIIIVNESIYYLYGDFSKWDGNDIFTMDESHIFYITERIRDRMIKCKFKNIKFEDVVFCE